AVDPEQRGVVGAVRDGGERGVAAGHVVRRDRHGVRQVDGDAALADPRLRGVHAAAGAGRAGDRHGVAADGLGPGADAGGVALDADAELLAAVEREALVRVYAGAHVGAGAVAGEAALRGDAVVEEGRQPG